MNLTRTAPRNPICVGYGEQGPSKLGSTSCVVFGRQMLGICQLAVFPLMEITLKLPTTTALSSVGRQRQLCPLAASDVPTAALHCRVPRVIKYAEGCWSPLYHSQKCHVLGVGSHWALVPASRRLSTEHVLCTGGGKNGALYDSEVDDLISERL
ncbi:uncharacterized protein Gm50595 isoform X3 [Mus musculus]|nr:uncharacterized protein Gm50595 isoform X3 [Mus musculus]|eukprot:XP_017174868.1 PREDICTED: uncharacterized protein LOC108168771 isoform X4 [Mus musculus]